MATLLSTLVGGTGSSGSDDDAREFKNFSVYAGMWHSWPTSTMEFSSSYIDGYTNDSLSGATESRFLTAAHTFTIPSGVTKVRITCIGAGGGGGSRQGQNYNAGGGGGGGAFAMGEFTVSAGEQLEVNPGKSGRSHAYNYQASGGTTTCVGAGSIAAAEISLSANGGVGGSASSAGSGATTKSVSGTRLIAGTDITSDGGNGGSGSTAAFGFGPEGYGGGGGGAAGFVLGGGGSGSNMSNNGGYSAFGGGGGAVGGFNGGSWPFGQASTSNWDYWAPAGAGAAANGADGSTQNASTPGGVGRQGTAGGTALGKHSSFHADGVRTGKNSPGSQLVADNSPGTGNSGPGGVDAYLAKKGGGADFTTYEKTFAYGPLASAYSSGGGGANGYSSYPYSYPGGHAGPGGGGGGAACYNQNAYPVRVTDGGYTRFDFEKGQFIHHITPDPNFFYGCWGGNSGVLGGGGGGGGYFGDGGSAGFGGGGGGAGGHYGSSYHGYGGYGGTGLVLIEWA